MNRTARFLAMLCTAMFTLISCVGVAHAQALDIALAPDKEFPVTLHTLKSTAVPDVPPAIFLDEMGNIISTGPDGLECILTLSSMFQSDEDGNLCTLNQDGTCTIIGKAPFLVAKRYSEDQTIALMDQSGNVLFFSIKDGKAVFDAALAPAVYMKDGIVISVDYFGRERIVSAPSGAVLPPTDKNGFIMEASYGN